MSKLKMLQSVVSEYGLIWVINRALYSARLRMFQVLPWTEKIFEKKIEYPKRVNLFHINIDELSQTLALLNDIDKENLIKEADKVCVGVIRGFSSIDLDYGNPINWQLNPITGKCADVRKKWYLIPDFDKERGDIKVIWEASRFSHFLTLCRAYLLTNNQKYYSTFSSQLQNWVRSNPYSYGANYKCGQECSFRMINSLLSYNLFCCAGLITEEDTNNMKILVSYCYRKVLSNFFYAYKCIKNNHTISEIMGIIVGAWCCNDMYKLRYAFSLLDKVIDEQFSDDGGYRQFSFNYQRLVLQDLECVLAIGNEVGMNLSRRSIKKIKAAAILMYQCQDETGDMPNYGSNDGALIFPITSCGYRNFKPTINAIYALATGSQLYDPEIHQEELIWFSGRKKIREYSIGKIKRRSSQFQDAGVFTLRNEHSWAMIVLNHYKSRPAHLDQLHFDLWVDDVNVFCDAGTYSYASELGRKLIQNESHNTAVVDGKGQMKLQGPFLIYDWTKSEILNCNETVFEGRMISKSKYEHIRKVERNEDGYLINDKVLCSSRCKIMFHTPCDVEIDGNQAVLLKNGIAICKIICDVTIGIERSRNSLYYLKDNETTCIAIQLPDANKELNTKIEIIKGDKKND